MSEMDIEFLALLAEPVGHSEIEAYFEEYRVINVRFDERNGVNVSSSLTHGVGIRVIDSGRT